MAKKNYKKTPKTNVGDIIEGFGFSGGPRGFSRSKPIKEVQTTPKKSLQNQKVSEKPKVNKLKIKPSQPMSGDKPDAGLIKPDVKTGSLRYGKSELYNQKGFKKHPKNNQKISKAERFWKKEHM